MHTFPDRGCARRGHGDSPRRACRALAWWRELLSSWWWQCRGRGDHRRDHRPGRRCRDRLARVLRATAAGGLLWVAAALLLLTAPARLLWLLSGLRLAHWAVPACRCVPRQRHSKSRTTSG